MQKPTNEFDERVNQFKSFIKVLQQEGMLIQCTVSFQPVLCCQFMLGFQILLDCYNCCNYSYQRMRIL